jgi:hypothetical protein
MSKGIGHKLGLRKKHSKKNKKEEDLLCREKTEQARLNRAADLGPVSAGEQAGAKEWVPAETASAPNAVTRSPIVKGFPVIAKNAPSAGP